MHYSSMRPICLCQQQCWAGTHRHARRVRSAGRRVGDLFLRGLCMVEALYACRRLCGPRISQLQALRSAQRQQVKAEQATLLAAGEAGCVATQRN